MKTEALQNSQTLKLILFTGCLITASLFSMCNQRNSKSSIEYGKSIYEKKCSSCHGFTTSSDSNAVTLMTLNDYDSSDLLTKLGNLTKDERHAGQLKDVKFSEREILALSEYIRNYFKPHY